MTGISAAAVARSRTLGEARWSPGGTRLAWLDAFGGRVDLVVAPADGRGPDLTITAEVPVTSLGAYGATKVFRARGPEGLAQPVIDVMAKVIEENGHAYALFGGGLLGFEIGAGLAARKQAGVTMEVTSVRAEDGKLVAERPILQDSKVSVSRYRGDLKVLQDCCDAATLDFWSPACIVSSRKLFIRVLRGRTR